MLHSDSLQVYTGELTLEVESAIQDISQYFGIKNPKVLTIDKWHIGIPVIYNVSLPTLGPVNGIDIRDKEPMIIQLSLSKYPHAAPYILSDRKDFPKANLSHLYFTAEGEPAKLCLVRNSLHEWFATINMSEFLDVGNQWLYKAATGQLNEDGNEFDPIRLEGNIFVKHIYRYELIHEVVANNQRFISDLPLALLGSAQLLKSGDIYALQTNVHVPFIAFEAVRNAFFTNKPTPEKVEIAANPLFTFVFWSENDTEEGNYLVSFPKNYGQLKALFSLRGLDLHQILLRLNNLGAIPRLGLPIILAIKRPLKVIGYNGNYEFLNFLIALPQDGVSAANDSTEVMIQGHIEPFSKSMANYLSNKKDAVPTLYIGAGSLGSKIILHDARSGNINIGVCDDDKFLPHNLARHALFSNSVGSNKAYDIVSIVKNFYPADNCDKIVAIESNAVFLEDELQHYRRIIDTTASTQIVNYMLSKKIPLNSRYIKAEIANEGALGLFYVEGNNRNPRMDDLVVFACYYATKNKQLRAWRMGDIGRESTSLNVGLGCSSTTSIMADDVLSLHAGVFSRLLSQSPSGIDTIEPGIVFLSSLDESQGFPSVSTEMIEVLPFDILECKNGSGWTVRMRSGIKQLLFKNCEQNKPNETGGVLIGVANYKTKTIHVFDIIHEPLGSKGTYCNFVRGAKDLPTEIDKIKLETGNVIGYIGEWHTHPMNLKRLSETDKRTIEELVEINCTVPIPTCAIIVTSDEILTYVKE